MLRTRERERKRASDLACTSESSRESGGEKVTSVDGDQLE